MFATPADLARLKQFDPADTPFGSRLRTVEMVAGALRGKASSWTRSSTPATRSSAT
jgi:hypothetical protein